MILSEIRDLALSLANSLSADGTRLPDSDVSDFKFAFNAFLNTAQNKFAEKDKIEAVYSVTQNPIPNLLGDTTAFDIVQHLGTDIIYSVLGARSYTLEVDKPCPIYFEENIDGVWINLATLTIVGVTSFTEYKGLLSPSNVLNEVRMRFSGAYVYNLRRVALYAYSFATASDVPQFKPWNSYALPNDYISTNRIVYNGDNRQRAILTDYYVDKKNFMVKRDVVGSFDLYYFKQPTTLILDTDTPEIQSQFHSYLAYFCAGTWLLTTGSQANGITLLNIYDNFLNEMKPSIDGSSNEIANDTNW